MRISVGVWRYRQVVGLELGIRLRGSVGDLDAQRVLRDLSHLVTLLGLLEDAQLRKDRQPTSRSTWGFSALGLGSVDAVIAALEPRGGASFEVLDHLPELFVSGFAFPRLPDSEMRNDAGRDVHSGRCGRHRELRKARGFTPEPGAQYPRSAEVRAGAPGLASSALLRYRRGCVQLTQLMNKPPD